MSELISDFVALFYTLHKIGVLYTINGYHTVAAENTRLGALAWRMAITAWLAYTFSQLRRLKNDRKCQSSRNIVAL
jgi:hypothetical protein